MAGLLRTQRLFAVEPFDMVGRDFGRVMNRLLDARPSDVPTANGVDVRQDTERLFVEVDLPGFKKDEIEIVLEKSLLTITAKHPAESVEPQGEWLLRERRSDHFNRTFSLPASVDGSAVDAKLEDGVLKITLQKREEAKPRRIAVN